MSAPTLTTTDAAIRQVLTTHLAQRVHPVHLADVVTGLHGALRTLLLPAQPVLVGNAKGHLADRELEVLTRMAQGMSNGQIARELYLSEDTVKTYARRLFRTLGARDRAHAVAIGYERGILGGDRG